MDFSSQVIIVTGSGSGIGLSCAKLLLEQGARVKGIDLQDAPIDHENYRHYSVNVLNELQIMEAMDDIQGSDEKIDGLVNGAGIFATSKPFFELRLDEWNKVMETNLTGVYLVSKYATLKMLPWNKGKIVNIACIRSRIFRPGMADYAASKAGVVALTGAMALDLQKYNIRVNSVAPGFTYTGMTATSFDQPEVRTFSESVIPVGKIAQPEDIAKVVLFLLSEASDYINGETIFADGGFSIVK